jgi:hypothetical protein
MSAGGVARSAILNEQELWRDMVRWSGGVVHEQDGLLFVAGPSSYLRVTIRIDGNVNGTAALRRSDEFFGASEGGHIVLVREPDDADLAQAALAAGYTPAWTERPMALHESPRPSPHAAEVDVRIGSAPRRWALTSTGASGSPTSARRSSSTSHPRRVATECTRSDRDIRRVARRSPTRST